MLNSAKSQTYAAVDFVHDSEVCAIAYGAGGSQPSGAGTPGGTSELPPTPGMGFDSQAPTPGGRMGPGMRSRASSFIPSAVSSRQQRNSHGMANALAAHQDTSTVMRQSHCGSQPFWGLIQQILRLLSTSPCSQPFGIAAEVCRACFCSRARSTSIPLRCFPAG